jgi:CysZ protein
MIEAAIKALAQMATPPFRSVLLKSVGLAVAVLIVVVIGLDRLLAFLTGAGATWTEAWIGPMAHGPLAVVGWILAIAAAFGLVLGALFLMPAVTSLIASFFADEIADLVEREHYSADPPGAALPVVQAAIEGIKFALLSVVVYLCALPFLFLAGFGAVIFFVATAYLLGREYFELAAMRFHSPAEAKALRRANGTQVFIAGLFIAGFVSIPIVNLATPLFGMAFMVHMYKRLVSGRRANLIPPEPRERPSSRASDTGR